MRFQPAHAAPRDSVPPPKRRRMPKSLRTALSVAVAATFGLVPAVMVASPAQAFPQDFLTISDAGNYEGQNVTFTLTYTGPAMTAPFVISVPTGGNAVASGGVLGVAGGGVALSAPGAPNAASGNDYKIGLVSDYLLGGGGDELTFPASSVSSPSTATVSVVTGSDTDTLDETFVLSATLAGAPPKTATGTIWALPVSPPAVTFLAPSTVPEGQSTVTVTATLASLQTHDVTIPMQSTDGTAVSTGGVNRDFTALPASSKIVIPAGQLSGTIVVSLWNDDVYEGTTNQTFTVGLLSGGTILGGSGGLTPATIGIVDNDAAPTVSIGDAPAVVEGGTLIFPITLSSLSDSPLTVSFATASGTDTSTTHGATASVFTGTVGAGVNGAANDFLTVPHPASGGIALDDGVVTIPALNRTVNKLVTTTASDSVVEGTETLSATLSAPGTGLTLGTPITATGTITDSDTGPAAAYVAPDATLNGTAFVTGDLVGRFVEGDVGERATFINLSVPAALNHQVPLQLNYSFVDGTATNGVDYRGSSGSFTIPVGVGSSGATAEQIPVTIIGDMIYDPLETFKVVLTSPNSTVSGLGTTTFDILDTGDVTPTWTTGDISVVEGNSGTNMAQVPIRLSGPTNTAVTFTAVTTPVSADETGVNSGLTVGADDYDLPTVQSVTVPAGSSTAYYSIPIKADVIYEHDESFTVAFTQVGSLLSDSTTDLFHSARVVITNDDTAPVVSFNQLAGTEGSTVRVIATTTGLSQYPYTLGFAVAPTGTSPATVTADYQVETDPLVTQAVSRGTQGALPLISNVYLVPDDIDEATETFGVTATEMTPLTGVATTAGVYRISDDPADLPPTASIGDESIKEYEGSIDMTVALAFTGDTTSSTQPFTLSYYTVDGSAVAGQDYTDTHGTLTIPAGTMSATINVPIKDDKLVEPDQDFFVKIGTPGPAGATLGKYVGEVTIHSDDTGSGEPAPSISAPASINGPGSVLITGSATTAGSWVELWGAPFGSPLENIVGISAKAGGAYAFSKYLAAGYKFQVKANGKSSAIKEVWVKELLGLSTSAGRGTIGMSATGNPKTSGAMVYFQVQNSKGTWVTLASAKTGATGNAMATLKGLKSGGKFSVRAVIAGSPAKGILSGTSAVKVVTVR